MLFSKANVIWGIETSKSEFSNMCKKTFATLPYLLLVSRSVFRLIYVEPFFLFYYYVKVFVDHTKPACLQHSFHAGEQYSMVLGWDFTHNISGSRGWGWWEVWNLLNAAAQLDLQKTHTFLRLGVWAQTSTGVLLTVLLQVSFFSSPIFV